MANLNVDQAFEMDDSVAKQILKNVKFDESSKGVITVSSKGDKKALLTFEKGPKGESWTLKVNEPIDMSGFVDPEEDRTVFDKVTALALAQLCGDWYKENCPDCPDEFATPEVEDTDLDVVPEEETPAAEESTEESEEESEESEEESVEENLEECDQTPVVECDQVAADKPLDECDAPVVEEKKACPECGKEPCECEKKDLTEKKQKFLTCKCGNKIPVNESLNEVSCEACGKKYRRKIKECDSAPVVECDQMVESKTAKNIPSSFYNVARKPENEELLRIAAEKDNASGSLHLPETRAAMATICDDPDLKDDGAIAFLKQNCQKAPDAAFYTIYTEFMYGVKSKDM